MEQRTRTIIINNATNETPHHQRKNQELRAKNTFGNNEYRTNNLKNQNNIKCVLITRRVFYFLFCSLNLCFFFGVCYCSLFLLLVRCPLFLLVVSIVAFGLLVFIVSDLVFVQKNQMKNNEHEYGTKNKNNNNKQRHKRNTINARTKKSERRTHSVTTNIEQTM